MFFGFHRFLERPFGGYVSVFIGIYRKHGTYNLPLNTSLEVQQLDREAVVHVPGFRCSPNCAHQVMGLWYLTVVVLEMVDMK